MSNTKHTPGPWMVDYKTMKVRAPNGLAVAEPFTVGDARLIAAAPDLLAALQRIAALTNLDGTAKRCDFTSAVYDVEKIATDALAKAGAL